MSDKINNNEIKNISDSSGLLFIFEMLGNFLENLNKFIKDKYGNEQDISSKVIFGRIIESKKLVINGIHIVKDIQNDLSGLNALLDNVPLLDESFKKAQDSLKDASNFAEEATLKIQDASISIQDSLNKVKECLFKLESAKEFNSDEKKILNSCINDISGVAETSFNIMTVLQFQDILRQQLSAIGAILTKVKGKIVNSIEKIEGIPVKVDENEKYFIPTDQSILEKQKGQDEIDSIISQVKNNKNKKE